MENRKKRAKAAAGPLRLAWPGGGTKSIGRQATLVSSQSSSQEASRKRKRNKKKVDKSLWTDKYAPTSSTNCCVAPKKSKDIRAWLTAASNPNQRAPRLLILVGSPGIGKSTIVQVLATELGWNVHEWSDSCTSLPYGGGGGNALASVDRSNALESFQDFLDRTGAGFSQLELSLPGMEQSKPKASGEGGGKSIIMIDEVSFRVKNLYVNQSRRC